MNAPFPASDPRTEPFLREYAVLTESDGRLRPQAEWEERFADVVKLARILCATPTSFISFVGDETQWLSARAGIDLRSSARTESFCAHAMAADAPTVIPDARLDPRFADNPFVVGPPFIRFYAGAPLRSPEGVPLGALCVASPEPRAGLTDDQLFGLSTLASQVMAQLDGRRESGRTTAANERGFRLLADAIPHMVWATRPDGHHEYFNARWYEFTGVPDGSTDGEGWRDLFHPDDQARAQARWQESLDTGEPYEIEYRLRHHTGRYRWTLGRALPLRGDDGTILRWFGTCTDIDDAKRLTEERELVAQELNHRIKNTFLVISGLIGFYVRTHPEARAFATDMRERIDALGRAHNFLRPHSAVSRPATSKTLHGVLGELFAPYHIGARPLVTVTGTDIPVDERGATPLALLMHELGTNAVKYGSLTAPGGTVSVRTMIDEETVKLEWLERGGPALPADAPPDGFGVRVSRLSVEAQLGGRFTRHWERDGLRVVIEIPRRSLDRGAGTGVLHAGGRTGLPAARS